MKEGYFNRSKFEPIMTFEAFQRLDSKVAKGQRLPDSARLKTAQYFGGKGANLLTSIVLFWLRQDKVFCYRNNSQGTARKMKDGSFKMVPGSKFAKGQGDVFSTINGRAVFWEIKAGADKMSEAQKIFKENIEKSGGAYFVIGTLDQFIEQYESLTKIEA